jgi:hypothetical protein
MIAALGVALPASAGSAPTLTATPNRNLPATATIRVAGTGFEPNNPVDLDECAYDGGWPSNCTELRTVTANASGSFGPVSVTVHQRFISESGDTKVCGQCAVVGLSRNSWQLGAAKIGFQNPCGDPTIVGTDGPDNLKGTSGVDVIVGRGGDDIIDGAGGNDVICSDGGNDVVYGGSGADRIYLGDGFDKAYGGLGNDKLFGLDDGDHLYGEEGNDGLFGGNGFDYCDGGTGTDSSNLCESTNAVP